MNKKIIFQKFLEMYFLSVLNQLKFIIVFTEKVYLHIIILKKILKTLHMHFMLSLLVYLITFMVDMDLF